VSAANARTRYRPSGTLGDGLMSTQATATQANGGGSPIDVTLSTAPVALAAQSLGSLAYSSVAFGACAGLAWGGTPGAISSARIHWVLGANSSSGTITLPSISDDPSNVMLECAATEFAPGSLEWTGARLDGMMVHVEADVQIPAGSTATLIVAELAALATASPVIVAGLPAGDASATVLGDAETVGEPAGDASPVGAL
jgi:hypothetical protein